MYQGQHHAMSMDKGQDHATSMEQRQEDHMMFLMVQQRRAEMVQWVYLMLMKRRLIKMLQLSSALGLVELHHCHHFHYLPPGYLPVVFSGGHVLTLWEARWPHG